MQVPDEDGAVIATRPQHLPVGAERESVHAGRVTRVDGAPLGTGHIPDHHQVVIGPGCQRGSVGAESHADDSLPMPGQNCAALPVRRIEQTDDDSLAHIGSRRERRSVSTDGDGRVRAVDLADLCSRGDVDDRSAVGAGYEDPFRVGKEDCVALVVRRLEGVLNYRSAALGHVPNERDCACETKPSELLVRHGLDVSAVRAEREASRCIVAEPRQRRADDLERRHVHDLERATIRCIERHHREAAVGADRAGDGWSRAGDGGCPPAGCDVVLAHAGRIGDSAREQGLAVGGEPEVEESFGLAPDDGDGVGTARDGGEQVGLRCGRVFEMTAFDREQEGLVEVGFHQRLGADAAGLGEAAGVVGPVPLTDREQAHE